MVYSQYVSKQFANYEAQLGPRMEGFRNAVRIQIEALFNEYAYWTPNVTVFRCGGGGTRHDPRIPCTDSRYCFPVKRGTYIAELCINMRTYKRARRFFDRSKGTKVQRARRLFWLRVSLPAADPLCTIAHCIVLFYGSARCCGHGIADPWLDTPSPRCCILFGINLTGIMKFGV